ncbi:MAG: hypothetical protein U0871_02005 [Gemmataceae bacterium]
MEFAALPLPVPEPRQEGFERALDVRPPARGDGEPAGRPASPASSRRPGATPSVIDGPYTAHTCRHQATSGGWGPSRPSNSPAATDSQRRRFSRANSARERSPGRRAGPPQVAGGWPAANG